MKTAILPIAAGFAASFVYAAENPSVVIICGDDLVYADTGACGAKLIPTPNLDKPAKESLVFTDGHCPAETCTPSRFYLLTGIHAFRHGAAILHPNAPMAITPDMQTMPQMFKYAGCQTAVIGKWHPELVNSKEGIRQTTN